VSVLWLRIFWLLENGRDQRGRERRPLGSSWAFVSFHQPTDCLTDGQTDGRKRSSVLYCTEKNFKIIYIYVVFIFVKHAVEIFLLPTNIVETGGLSVFFRQPLVTQQCSKHFYELYYTLYNSLIVILASDLFLRCDIFYLKYY